VTAASWRKVGLKTLGWGAGTLAFMVGLDAYKHHGFRIVKLEVLVALMAASIELLRGVLYERGFVRTAKALMWVVFVGVLGLGQYLDHRTEAMALTDDELTALVSVGAGADKRLRHPGLGFSIKDPGPDFKIVGTKVDGPTAVYRGYRNAAGEVLTLGLIKGTGESEASLRELLAAMKDVPIGNLSKPLDVTRLETSGGDKPEGRLNGWVNAFPGELSFRVRAHGFTRDSTSYAFLVGITSREPDALSEVLDSFER
jgi:hypothetical protein